MNKFKLEEVKNIFLVSLYDCGGSDVFIGISGNYQNGKLLFKSLNDEEFQNVETKINLFQIPGFVSSYKEFKGSFKNGDPYSVAECLSYYEKEVNNFENDLPDYIKLLLEVAS